MLGRENKECRTEQRVGASGEHFNAAGRGVERDSCTFAAVNPVALHHLDWLWPIQTIKIFDEAICIRCDAHHPLLHVALEHGIVADVASTFRRDFFVRKNGAEAWAPVHRSIGEIRQAICIDKNMLLRCRQCRPCGTIRGCTSTGIKFSNEFIDATCATLLCVVPRTMDLQEDPLCPFIKGFISSADAAARVVTQTKAT